MSVRQFAMPRRLETFVEVAAAHTDRRVLVARVRREIAFGPDLRSAGLQRLLLIEHERQRFVGDVDQLERVFRRMTIDSSDRGDRLADEAYGIVERTPSMLRDLLDLFLILRAAGDRSRTPDDVAAVFVREHCFHAGQRERFRRVDLHDPRVRMRTAQDARVQHPGQTHVAGVGRLPAHALDGVDARRRHADDG